ncbi:MAG: sulfatase-like hydrolase/transferase [Mariniphaga sp.]|nr:sulfatase-like hydrolase/transferase [Mariniphaga sp.]
MNRLFLFCSALLFTLIIISCEKQHQRPNIVIFFSDDMRDVDVSMYGRNQPTPNLQRLTDAGILFNNAYCSSGMCTPSRYTLMTGNFAGRCQTEDFLESNPLNEPYAIAWNTHLSEKDKTIAEYLNEAGYYTGYVGKYHMGGDKKLVGFPRFESGADPYSPEVDSMLKNYQKNLQNYVKKVAGFDYAASVLWANYEQNPIPDICFHNFEWMTKGAIDFLENTGDEPFFLYTATTALHGPPHHKALDLDPHVTPGGLLKNPTEFHPSRAELKQRLTDSGFEPNHHNVGLAMLDDHVAAVMKKLEELGKAENTLVIFLSDHGVEPGKASCYEVGSKIPMVVHWPAVVKSNSEINQNTQIVDLLPTILEAAGNPLPENKVDGISFLDAIKGNDGIGRKYLYFENGYSRAVSDGTYKFMTLRYPESVLLEMKEGKHDYAPNHLNFPMQGNSQIAVIYHPAYFEQDQLYNYVEDYWEQTNLANDPQYAQKVIELSTQLGKQMGKFRHPYPLGKQDFMETEKFKKLAQKTRELGTDWIYWWNPNDRDLPPGYH